MRPAEYNSCRRPAGLIVRLMLVSCLTCVTWLLAAEMAPAQYSHPQPRIEEVLRKPDLVRYEPGQSFTVYVKVRNLGTAGKKGGITISFPDDPQVYVQERSTEKGGLYGGGQKIFSRSRAAATDWADKYVEASYVIAEAWTNNQWDSNQTHSIKVEVTPSRAGPLRINIRSVIWGWESPHSLSDEYLDPASGPEDQQGYPVRVETIQVESLTPTSVQPSETSPQDNQVSVAGYGGGTDNSGLILAVAVIAVLALIVIVLLLALVVRQRQAAYAAPVKVQAIPMQVPPVPPQTYPFAQPGVQVPPAPWGPVVPTAPRPVVPSGPVSAGDGKTGSLLKGRYLIQRVLGRGASGMVYEAIDQQMGRHLAIKHLALPEQIADSHRQKSVQRFLREAGIAARLNHPNIVTIFDVLDEQGQLYIAMELIGGISVRELLVKEKKLAVGRTVRMALQICDALECAHAHGIVHRDIKPENLMVVQGDLIKVMDFGIARPMESTGVTMAGEILGTPRYMSPEQIRAEQLDGRSDIFSLGMVLYEMVSGCRAMEGEEFHVITYGIMHRDIPPLRSRCPNVPESVERIIMQCLRKSLAERFQSATQLAAAFRGAQIIGSPQ